jgi:hypothetical protein
MRGIVHLPEEQVTIDFAFATVCANNIKKRELFTKEKNIGSNDLEPVEF